jgi:copper homeostasis protein
VNIVRQKILREACVDSLDYAILAERLGADRIELCANLHLNGTTPDRNTMRDVLYALSIPVKMMIRPRGGDFVYCEEEFNEMLEAIAMCRELRVSEIVTGVLLPDRSLDLDRITELAQTAFGMRITIHKCIDLVPDVFTAIEQLKEIPGVTGILSSGQAETAWEGRGKLRKMLNTCGNDITLIVAGRVTSDNLAEHVEAIGAREYHGRQIV